jgi:hypothetical protein
MRLGNVKQNINYGNPCVIQVPKNARALTAAWTWAAAPSRIGSAARIQAGARFIWRIAPNQRI